MLTIAYKQIERDEFNTSLAEQTVIIGWKGRDDRRNQEV
jgi:hypothetical protein